MAESDHSEKDHCGFGTQSISNMCSQLKNNLSGNGLMSQLRTMKFPEKMSSKIPQASAEAEPDSRTPDDQHGNSSTDSSSSLKSMALTRTLDFDKIFSTVGKMIFDPSDSDDLDDEGSESNEGEVQSARVRSKFLHNLPLYQDYCLSVRDDILRLKKSELLLSKSVLGLKTQLGKSYQSRTESPQRSHSLSPGGPICSTPPTPIKVTPSTLWQDLEEVKGSGVLQNLSARETRLHETSFELICSEASYMRSLEITVKHFYVSNALRQTLTQMEHHILFSNIQRVMVASERFLTDLELRLGECILIGSQVGEVVLRHCPAFRRLYVPYVTNMSYQEALIGQLLQRNKDFQHALSKLEKSPVCQRQSLKSFLVLPFQRITRIKLILEASMLIDVN
ncbi:rho guanine nucleotide exchange factor 19 [Periophthalmus magnuspinnatus]|uniref:rho guanine nucleotide exchange factor 19 n=1 Tax=Periophthalmus magnuspinnatus TaxID=409849 RepID=UPI0024373A99|nr:rho guanine nucleotide exchange factor 19 [Periophthalmus magnuspinnatus]